MAAKKQRSNHITRPPEPKLPPPLTDAEHQEMKERLGGFLAERDMTRFVLAAKENPSSVYVISELLKNPDYQRQVALAGVLGTLYDDGCNLEPLFPVLRASIENSPDEPSKNMYLNAMLEAAQRGANISSILPVLGDLSQTEDIPLLLSVVRGYEHLARDGHLSHMTLLQLINLLPNPDYSQGVLALAAQHKSDTEILQEIAEVLYSDRFLKHALENTDEFEKSLKLLDKILMEIVSSLPRTSAATDEVSKK